MPGVVATGSFSSSKRTPEKGNLVPEPDCHEHAASFAPEIANEFTLSLVLLLFLWVCVSRLRVYARTIFPFLTTGTILQR